MDLDKPQAPALAALSEASEEQVIALLEIMHFVAKADGFLSADELREFLKFARTVADGKVSATQLGELVSGWGKRKLDDVPARLFELGEILSTPELRRAAYDLASKMATADGKLEASEMRVLELVEEALRLS